MKNEICRWFQTNELKIQIILFLLVSSIFVADYIFWKKLNDYGLLFLISLLPWLYLLWWWLRTGSRPYLLSFLLGSLIIGIYFFLFFPFNLNIDYILYIKQLNCKDKSYLPIILILLLSFYYGIISIFSCIYGLKIRKKHIINEGFEQIIKSFAFISIAVAIYLFLLERILGGEKFEFDPFMVGFLIIAVAMSFLYLIFGYFSQNTNGNLNPSIFLISAGLSFSIGSAFSILVLEFIKRIKVLPTHWVFLCIWSLFIVNIIIFVSENVSGSSKFLTMVIEKILGSSLDNETYKSHYFSKFE